MINQENRITSFEKNSNTTATYFEAIEHFEGLSASSNIIQTSPFGMTDSGFPLHEVIIDIEKDFDPVISKEKGKTILFLNNAIHPGEPCGVDASMMLARDLIVDQEMTKLLESTVIVIIPFYNISGGLNRGSHSRANQDGPEEYGFRGNIQNLDLNRDFVKCDSKNAKSFNQLFTKWSPHIFIDNHTSNGADYQYTMTLIPTQKDKLGGSLANYMTQNMLPDLYSKMENADWEMTPYVYARTTPDDGIAGFLDLPRYSSGYGAMKNAISFMPETHMLKPYKNRVWSTYHFMKSMIEHISINHESIQKAKKDHLAEQHQKSSFDLNWALDSSESKNITFKGYEAKYKPSEVSGQDRLYYDRESKYTKEIKLFDSYKTSLESSKPDAYIIPQAYTKIIDRLKWNGVSLKKIETDRVIDVEYYFIEDLKTADSPYEGHYLHRDVQVSKKNMKTLYRKGDYIVETSQEAVRYIIESLEPQAPDSFFAWNFFDAILNQKEYFSPYVFEDVAAKLLEENKKLRIELEKLKAKDLSFAEDGYAQLEWVYKKSHHYEHTHKRYPIARFFYK